MESTIRFKATKRGIKAKAVMGVMIHDGSTPLRDADFYDDGFENRVAQLAAEQLEVTLPGFKTKHARFHGYVRESERLYICILIDGVIPRAPGESVQ